MLRIFVLSSVTFFTSWSAAFACSPSLEARTGEQNYNAINPKSYNNRNFEKMSVGVVYVKQVKRKIRKVPHLKDVEKPYVKVKYRLIDKISEDFTVDEKKWIPAISKTGIENELKIKDTDREFEFWDRKDISTPQVYGYAGLTSCGPSPSNTLLPDQYYLQFKSEGRTVGMEIISGPEDKLVSDFKKIYSGAKETKIRRSPLDYFSEMSGYQDIEVVKCPNPDEIFKLLSIFERTEIKESLRPSNIFRQNSSHKSELEDLNIIDLASYQTTLNEKKPWDYWQCDHGKRYLVLEKTSSNTRRGGYDIFFVNPPKHRYIEIINGSVDTNDILSLITILNDPKGSSKIDVNKVKSWIKHAESLDD